MSSETISLFLNKALQRILKDSSRRHTQLRETIKVALDAIQGSQLSPESPEWDRIATKLVIPLKHACETRQSKIMGTALDCLQKLMAYGLIRGTAIDEEKPDKKLIENVIETIGACFDFPDDNVQLQIIKAFLTAVTSPICDIHDNCLMNAIRSVYNIYLVTKNQVNITTAKATLTQMLNIIFQRMEISKNASQPNSPALPRNNNDSNTNNNNNNTSSETANGSFVTPTDITEEPNSKDNVLASSSSSVTSPPMSPSLKHGSTSVDFNDCFLIFRALCKLSMKDVPEGAGPDAMDMKSKLLSLELIQMILESSGPAFRHSERFVNSAIKKYLCASLLNNGVSPVPRVFKLSLSIFLALMSHFRENLKAEIGVFFSRIFLWILENNNSTIQQKWMVLQVLYQICKNPQTLVDIFVNYDCDPEAKDIFERMVYDLSRIAQGGNTVSGDHFSAPAAQELKVKTLGLECLVTIMKSLVDWSKELYEQTEKENVTETPDGSASSAVNSSEDLDGLEQMRKQKQFKLVIETGKQKFNVSPKKGIDYLIQGEVIQNTAASISNFLKGTEGLDRTKIGEYLGDSDPFTVSVLYAYVDLFSFQRLTIDSALREFLSYFRLPSDGHKIDRMLEKFAERYFNNNQPSSFANADAVYTLAFAIVVLLTDLHSPTVQTKMTKQDWFKMNKGCNGAGDFDYNMLYVIYDNCAQEPLRLRGEKDGYGTALASASAAETGSDSSIIIPAPASPHEDNYLRSLAVHITNVLMFWSIDSRQKQLRFIKESEELVKSSQASIQEKMKRKAKFFTATHIEHVRPMFELAWCPMLAAFSVLLEDSEDGRVIALCLEGFNYAIHVACIFFMAIERSTFITSLSKFTLLDSLREMRPKNIESIKAVINIANAQGNYLQESWAQVLKCFSLLERLHVIGSGVKINTLSNNTEPDPKKYTRGFTSDFFGAKPNPKAFEEVNAEYVAQQIDTSAVDRVYTSSIHLSNSAIVSFVKSLCEVSVEEINNAAPRIFSLQKLVEICYYNMNRLRIVWASIWSISASHFTKIGCHDNKGIAMYAIDSLRQLSMKFLEKDELAHYTFQKEFLRPFEHIIHNNPSVDIREFVIRCLTQMIQALGKNIKSGWKSVFLVFATAASDPDPQIVNLAFTTVDHLMQDYFAAVADTFFIDCVSCVGAFSWNKHDPAISQKSIDWLNFCSAQLYTGKVEPLPAPSSDGVIFTNSDRHTSLWFPILTGLTKSTQHKDSTIRISSLQVLFRQLSMYGRSFSNDLWGLILQKVLLPIFEPTGYDGHTILTPLTEDTEWLTTTCTEAFRLLVEFYTDFFDKISFLLYAILDLVVACILQDNETLSRKAMATLLSLTLTNGSKFTDEMWSTICSEYGQILEQNLPHEIFHLQTHARMQAQAQAQAAQSQPPALQLPASSLAPPVTSPTSHSAPPTPFMASTSSSSSSVSTPLVTPSPLSQSIPQISIDGTPADAEPPTTSPRMAPKRVRKASSTTSSVMLDFANTIRSKCTVQLLSIQAISDIFFSQYSSLSTHHMISLVDSLDVVYNFSYKINREPSVTSTLSKMNLLELFQKLELQAILSYLQMLFKLYSESSVDASNRKHQAELRLISRCAHILTNVDKGETTLPTESALSRNHPNNIAIIVQVLKGFLSLSDQQFSTHLPQFYGEFVDLMLHGNKEIRIVLSEVMQRVGPTFDIVIEYPSWLDRAQMDRFLEKPKARKPVVREDDAYTQAITETRDSLASETQVQETQESETQTPETPAREEVKVETVVTTEEVKGHVEMVEESADSTSTEIIVQDVPSDQLPDDSAAPYTETTTFTEVEVVPTPDGGSTTNVIATGQITTVVEVTSEPSESDAEPINVSEPTSELVDPTPEPTLEEPTKPVSEPVEPVVEPTSEPTEPSPELAEPTPAAEPTPEPASEPTKSIPEPTTELTPTPEQTPEPTEPQTQLQEPTELQTNPSEPIEPQTKSSEPTNAEAEDQDDFVMVESPSQQHPTPSNPFEDKHSDHSDRSDPFEVVAPEETPLVHESEENEKMGESEENEKTGESEEDEFPDELSASDTPIFDSVTANALVDGTLEKESEISQKEKENENEIPPEESEPLPQNDENEDDEIDIS